MNSKTQIGSELARRSARFRSLKEMSVARVTQLLDAFEAGYMRDAAMLWETLEHRDDLLRAVVSKRKKSVARHGWVVLPMEGLDETQRPEAEAQVAALEYFYRNLEAENALDLNERGGFGLLTRQMMDAVGKKYAVHEMVWQPRRVNGKTRLTARFRFVPLPFFENTQGELRFVREEWALEGKPLEPGSWMVTVGEGLMRASSLAWSIKNTVLSAWANFCDHNGTPGVVARSSATRGSDEWKALEECLEQLHSGLSAIHGVNDEVTVLDMAPGGSAPFPLLVDRLDRMLAVLWRGADLSTISRDRGYGASLQERETCALEEDDAWMLTETLRRQVDEWVIRYTFGPGAKPLAGIKILVTPRECTATDIQIDEFLLKHGAPLAVEETMHRYGRKPAVTPQPVLQAGEARTEVKTSKH